VSPRPVFLKPVRKLEVKQPIKKVDLTKYDLTGGEKSLIEKAIAANRFRGFSRTNLRGEQWKPGPGLGPGRTPPRKPVPVAVSKPAPPVIAPELLPGNFQTHEHVNKFFGKTFPNATIEALDKIPVGVWNTHARELEMLAKKFPEVASRLKKISADPSKFDDINPVWYAAADTEKGSVLLITPKHNQDLSVMAARDAKTVKEGWWPKGAEPSQSIMTHEWGHLVDAWIKEEGRGSGYTFIDPGPEASGYWSDWYRLRQVFLKSGRNPLGDVDPTTAVSIYSRTNHKEAVAEAFSAARWTPKDEKTPTLENFEAILRDAITWIRNKQP
jgi:hypothetical protein